MSFSVFRGKNYCFAICSNFFEKLFFALHSLPFCPFFSVFQHNAIFCSQPSLTLSLQTNVFYPLANSYQRIFEQQNTAVFKHFWQAFLSWNGLSDRPSQKFMAGMSCVRVDYIFGKHLIYEDLFPTGRQDWSVDAGPKSSKSLSTVSVLPKMTESHDDASTVILQVRPLSWPGIVC